MTDHSEVGRQIARAAVAALFQAAVIDAAARALAQLAVVEFRAMWPIPREWVDAAARGEFASGGIISADVFGAGEPGRQEFIIPRKGDTSRAH